MNDTIGTLAFYSWIKEFNAPPGTPGITEMYFDWLVYMDRQPPLKLRIEVLYVKRSESAREVGKP